VHSPRSVIEISDSDEDLDKNIGGGLKAEHKGKARALDTVHLDSEKREVIDLTADDD
jgi:hypothetical protein